MAHTTKLDLQLNRKREMIGRFLQSCLYLFHGIRHALQEGIPNLSIVELYGLAYQDVINQDVELVSGETVLKTT